MIYPVKFLQVKVVLLTVIALIAALAYQEAFCETGASSVDVTAGIAPMMTLTCTPVNLGVWRTPPRKSGGTTRIMLDIDYPLIGTKVSQNTAIARASAYADWTPDFGVCTVENSRAVKLTSARVKIINNRLLKVVPVADRHTKVKAGRPGFGIRIDVYAPTLVNIDNGSGSFLIGGGMTIPEKIEATDYGGYLTAVYPMITVDDGIDN
jgi:hypothetical protein